MTLYEYWKASNELKEKSEKERDTIIEIIQYLKVRTSQGKYNQATGARLVKLPEYDEVMMQDVLIEMQHRTLNEVFAALIRMQINKHIEIKSYLDYNVNYEEDGKGYLNERIKLTKEGEIAIETGFYEEAYLKRFKLRKEYELRNLPAFTILLTLFNIGLTTCLALYFNGQKHPPLNKIYNTIKLPAQTPSYKPHNPEPSAKSAETSQKDNKVK